MNEYDSEVAHSGNGINTSQTTTLRPIWQFAIDRFGPANLLGRKRGGWQCSQNQLLPFTDILIEYALLVAFVALASAALFIGAGGSIQRIWTETIRTLDSVPVCFFSFVYRDRHPIQ